MFNILFFCFQANIGGELLAAAGKFELINKDIFKISYLSGKRLSELSEEFGVSEVTINHNREYWKDYFVKRLSERYGYSYDQGMNERGDAPLIGPEHGNNTIIL